MNAPKRIKITQSARPANTIKAPRGFIPMRIKLQRARKEARKNFMDDCAAWQEHIEQTEELK